MDLDVQESNSIKKLLAFFSPGIFHSDVGFHEIDCFAFEVLTGAGEGFAHSDIYASGFFEEDVPPMLNELWDHYEMAKEVLIQMVRVDGGGYVLGMHFAAFDVHLSEPPNPSPGWYEFQLCSRMPS